MRTRIFQLHSLFHDTVRKLLHRVICALQNVRRIDFSAIIGLRNQRLEVCIRRNSERINRLSERSQILRDGHSHVRRIRELLKARINECRRELLGFLTDMFHCTSGLNVIFHRRVMALLDALHTLHRCICPRIDLFTRFTSKPLVRT